MRIISLVLLTSLGTCSYDTAEFSPNVTFNEQTINRLIEVGSDPAKPHLLEHHFYFTSVSSRNELIVKGESLGYQSANLGEDEVKGAQIWYVDLINETVLDLQIINSENSIMLELADEFGAIYDGWGTFVVE